MHEIYEIKVHKRHEEAQHMSLPQLSFKTSKSIL